MSVRTRDPRVIHAAPTPDVVAGNGAAVAETGDVTALAQSIIDQWKPMLEDQSAKYTQEATEMANQPAGQGLGKITTVTVPYPWFDVLLIGPFQGPAKQPSRIIEAGDPAFLVGAIWRNPAPINWAPPMSGTPSAAVMMAPLDFRLRVETVNLTDVMDGPDFGPFNFAPIDAVPNPTFFVIPLTFPAPPQGKPTLYDMYLTADVSGPVGGMPFAGWATWVFDPNYAPPTWAPPGPGLPPVAPGLRYDRPVRVEVYKA